MLKKTILTLLPFFFLLMISCRGPENIVPEKDDTSTENPSEESPSTDPEEDKNPDPGTNVKTSDVILDQESFGVYTGYNYQLNATVTPDNATDKSLIWTSENESVATVDSAGKVTGIAAGSTAITAKTVDGGFSDSATVTVEIPPAGYVAVTAVSLNTGSTTIEKSDTFQLTATINPGDATNKNMSWSSSDESVATVDNEGLVTGISGGHTTITVYSEDGNFSAAAVVTVKVSPTDIHLYSKNELYELQVGDQLDFYIELYPMDSTDNNYTVKIADPSLLEVTKISGKDFTVKALAEGSTDLIVSCSADTGISSSRKITTMRDDLIKPIIDPEYEFIETTSNNQFSVTFSEKMDVTTLEITENYSLKKDSDGSSVAITSVSSSADSKTATISLSESLEIGEEYTLTVTNVTDTAGNTIKESNKTASVSFRIPLDVAFDSSKIEISDGLIKLLPGAVQIAPDAPILFHYQEDGDEFPILVIWFDNDGNEKGIQLAKDGGTSGAVINEGFPLTGESILCVMAVLDNDNDGTADLDFDECEIWIYSDPSTIVP